MTTLSSIRNAAIEDAGAGGLTVYATKEDLPASGLTAGDQAYVSASSRLYVSNGSGWYNVALINATPSLSIDPTGAISLSTTGETTTITLTATDSDNAVAGLTYSVESDGSFAGLGTISQDSSVFTITPLGEDSATTVESTLTFKASDGINFGSGDRTLTLSFKVENSNYTTLLLKNEETTDNQVDASTNSHSITEVGNVTSTALTPYHPGGYSTYFDGTSNSQILIQGEPTLAIGTGDFSFSCWYKSDGALDGRVLVSSVATTSTTQLYWNVSVQSNGAVWLQTRSTANSGLQKWGKSATGLVTANTWHHIAISRQSGWHYVAVDGVQDTSVYRDQASFNLTAQELAVGASNITAYQSYNKGYIRDLNFCVGGVEYDLSVGDGNDAYTVPTEPISAHANTKFLLSGLPYIVDASASPLTIDFIGSAVTKLRDGPYDTLGYTKADHGGSVYFDGSGDYLQLPSDAGFSFGTGDFTVEAWVYYPAISNTNGKIVIDSRPTSTNGSYWLFGPGNSGVMSFRSMTTGGNSVPDTVARPNQWVHYAATRSGTSLRLFANGELVASTTDSSNISSGSPTIGKNAFSSVASDTWWLGYISDMRIVKGTAVYTSAFTPPTAPLTAITNTQLLTCTNKNDIWDASSGNLLTKAGDVTGGGNSGTLKFGKTAMYFDGTGDFISAPTSQTFDLAGSIAWTIEGWFYWSSLSGEQTLVEKFTGGTGPGWTLYKTSSNAIGFYSGSSASFSNAIGTVTSGQWYHVALTRDAAGTTRGFLDGTLNASGTYSIGNNSTGNLYIGARNGSANYMNGYVQDLRITKGLARYTGNFTPPTTEFDG